MRARRLSRASGEIASAAPNRLADAEIAQARHRLRRHRHASNAGRSAAKHLTSKVANWRSAAYTSPATRTALIVAVLDVLSQKGVEEDTLIVAAVRGR